MRKHGLTQPEIDEMDPDERASWSIVFSEFEGSSWDDRTGEWRKPGSRENGDA